ncbi:TonB-dependent siderophore receptor [Massilia sp. TS11]|uniref:TonB-dependent siderophore receptor n=1 Tax=Massilia sp. TS11 TaxID=2908003 RepID=UPI001EDB2662|nr:TonB-dependent siderophore receptor [Massilia sp. TS11]MCG2583276.1 TonB-dependent siderophore receptor [Massilia sp. TS11]
MKTRFTPTLLALAIAQLVCAHAAAQQTLPEVIVTGSKAAASERASVGGFGDAPVMQTPAAITVISGEQLKDLGITLATQAMRLDASVGDAYNAVGYAEQFSIRGYTLDNASSYRKDGFAIPADAQIPLENKERIEVLKGLAGLQAGVAAPGGIINYVTKRPTASTLRSATASVSERGTLYAALDLGGRFEDTRFGYRLNAAAERIRSQVKGADGERQFVSAAFDFRLAPGVVLAIDGDYQHKSQITVPGYQLINNRSLPRGVSADTLLNNQPWTKPVDTRSGNLGARLEIALDGGWQASFSANRHWFKRDDFTAFPYGCSSAELWPGYCANGDYDVYDYQSEGEKKSPWALQAMLRGSLGAHALSFGASTLRRKDQYGDYVYDYAGVSNIYRNRVVPPAPGNPHTGPVYTRRTEKESALFAQDILTLNDQWKLHAGVRVVQAGRDDIDAKAHTDESFVLPNAALVFTPAAGLNLYASVAQGMEHGGVAPVGTTNANKALSPSRSKQAEIGLKAQLGKDLAVTAALFDISKGLEFTNSANTFVRSGEDRHRGLELAVQGKQGAIDYGVSATALNTRESGTGIASMDGKRVTDVPALRSLVWGDLEVDGVPGLKLSAQWQYSGKKAFDVENTTFVPDYHVVNLGASYATRVGGSAVTVRAFVDNAFNKFYWRDVTPALGGYLMPGLSRTVKLSATLDF